MPNDPTTVGPLDGAPTVQRNARRGPVRTAERSLAPDLARGSALLFIALANVSAYLHGRELGPGSRPVGGSALDDVLDFLVAVLVDGRAYPMFALLFGYGMVQLTGRQLAGGATWSAVRRLLLRRQIGLVLFGAGHAFLLFHGDVLGLYGATGLVLLLVFRRSRRALLWWASITAVLLAGVLAFTPAATPAVPARTDGYLAQAVDRLLEWSMAVGLGVLMPMLLAPMLVGVLMARAQLLERPAEHVVLLRRIAICGLAVGILGGVPYGILVAGWEPVLPVAGAAALHGLTGVVAGAGYAAAFGLWAAGRTAQGRRGPIAVLAASGQRSLTCYLWQSVLFAPLLAAWGLGLGARLPTSLAYLLAVLVWAGGLLLARWLDRAGSRGPAETVLRRITYGTLRT